LLFPPGVNCGFVALDCPFDRLLHAPSEIMEQAPDMVGMLRDPKFALDQRSDTCARPDSAKEAKRLGATGEQQRDLGALFGR
jgi:hypothetical protein